MMSALLTRLASRVSMMSGEVLAQADTAAGAAAPAGAAAAAGAGQAAAAVVDTARDPAFIVPDQSTSMWLPERASVTADNVDWMFDVVLWLSVFCFIGIAVAVVYFVYKYRARPGHKAQPSPTHNDVIETIWTVIPSLICVALFVGGWRGFVDMNTPPKHALEVQVIGRKWSWEFIHPNGVKDSVLHVPVDRSVRLVMKAEDTIHSFYVPAFRIKRDVIPRRYTQLWFKAEDPTVSPDKELQSTEVTAANDALVRNQKGHRMFCAEYCGTEHSLMKTRVVVHNTGGYDQYLAFMKEKQDAMSPVERGQDVYSRLCFACHTVDGSRKVGPSFQGIWGKTHTFTDGATAVVDENYIRNSVLNPQGQVVQGFPPSMPSFQGQLSDKEIMGVIEYIKSLK